ncbi:hypothetical protein [Pyruvatibacter mobilis]|uniref:hypothetical protein n=1 Tax=Pyruvatibacter mobilis TaxID=1712261 RepID=UPI003BAB12EE
MTGHNIFSDYPLSDIRKAVKEIGAEWRDVAELMANGTDFFAAAGDYWLLEEKAVEVLAEQLEGDPYVLGCFHAEFLADVTGWPSALIKAAQESDPGTQALGEMIIQEGKTERLAECYIAADGAGHHFNSWDGSEQDPSEWFGYYRFPNAA